MSTAMALHRSRLEQVLGALSVDEMVWAMKFLTDKLSSQVKVKNAQDTVDEKVYERAKTEKFLNEVCGKWEDDKDADEMVRDIYESRVNKDYTELEKIFS